MTNASGIKIRPIKAFSVGILITIVIPIIFSSILGIIVITVYGPQALIDKNSSAYMVFCLVELIIGLISLYSGGYFSVKYTPTKEKQYGILLGILTLIITLFLDGIFYFYTPEQDLGPIWLNVINDLLIIPTIYLGTELRMSNNSKVVN